MADQFCLKWNNHQSTLVSVFDILLESETHVDCTLASNGQYLKAHKVVLSACSPYLEEILRSHQDKHPILIFNDISFEELKAMLEYMYRGEVNVSQDQLNTFLKAAEALKIKGLTDHGGGTGETTGGGKRKGDGMSGAEGRPEDRMGGSPKRRRPQVQQPRRVSQHDNLSEDSTSNSCEPPQQPSSSSSSVVPIIKTAPSPSPQEFTPASLPRVKKVEPPDVITPKTEVIEEPQQEDIEDLTLDDDEEEDISTSAYDPLNNPGTSQGQHQSFAQSQEYSNWQMGGEAQNDEVFMAAQQAISQSNSQDDLVCPRCNRKYSSKQSLYMHRKYQCGIEPKFHCPHCPYKAKQRQNLKLHIFSRHKDLVNLP
jgi:rubrerythrin